MAEPCAHCGLPLGRRALAATIEGMAGRYCCVGCVLAQQVTRATGDAGHAAAVMVRLGVAVFFAVNVMMVTMPSYVPAIYGDTGLATDGPLFVVLRWLAMVLAAPVVILLGGPILAATWRALRAGIVAADALVVLGTVSAYGLSVANTVAGRPAVYYDTATMLLVLVTLGRYLEARARADAGALVRRTLARGAMRAQRVGAGGIEHVEPDRLAVGDVVLVAPGDAFPTDGAVLSGEGGVDEAALTGEALPVLRRPGDAVCGGSASVDGTFRVRVTAPVAESTTARIAALVDTTLATRTRAERVADRVAGVLVPVVVAGALAAGAWWTATAGLDRGILVALAVLVVACPCGLGLATPLAVWTGVVAAAERGIIVRGGPVLERLAGVRRVLLDKTGTLTTGEPRLARVEPADRAGEVLALAAGLEQGLAHPIARGIADGAGVRGVVAAAVQDAEVVPGRGVRGTMAGVPVAVGSAAWLAPGASGPGAAGGTGVVVARDGRMLGTLWLEESLREGVEPAIAGLRALGLGVGVVSGDLRAPVVERLFEPAELAMGLLPEEKVARIRAAHAAGSVAMVGDGFNDAPALAAADVGIAVGEAADLTRTTADVVVREHGVAQLPWLVAHARRVVRVARQSLAWAFGYNAIAVGLAASGRLEPVVAALAMLASSLAVVANARRLRAAAPAATADHAPVAQALPHAA